MAKKTMPEVKEGQKTQTKYDRKMAARKLQEEKDRRDEKIFKTTSTIVGIVVILAIVIGIGSSVYNRVSALNGTYIKIGDRSVSKLEFDYYYNASVNEYINSYGSLLPYMGLDTSRNFADQVYNEETGMSWKDNFDEMAVDQMIQIFALADDARANGFSYDTESGYTERIAAYEQAAGSAGISAAEYYKSLFGQYATEKNIAPFVKEELLAAAYYNHLLEVKVPSDEEIQAYYQENPQNYDKIDYRNFIFNADIAEDASEEDVEKAMNEIKEKAEAFAKARKGGSDFEELCIENASEEEKADYEDEETEFSLKEGQRRGFISSVISDWLFDDARSEGDIEVLAYEDGNQYYVVEFVSRYYDAETTVSEISSSLASTNTTEYIADLIEKYEVTDSKGKLKYLTIDTAAEAGNEGEETEAEGTETEEPKE